MSPTCKPVPMCCMDSAKVYLFLCLAILFVLGVSTDASYIPSPMKRYNDPPPTSTPPLSVETFETSSGNIFPPDMESRENGETSSNWNSTRVSNRILVILKLLQAINQFSAHRNASDSSQHNETTASESRSMMSWLRLKKPSQRQETFSPFDRSVFFPFDIFRNERRIPYSGMSTFNPNTYSTYPKLEDPNPVLFLPSLSDAAGIDYWLKFIENAKLDERPLPIRESFMQRPVPVSHFRRVKHHPSKHQKNRGKQIGRKTIKLQNDENSYPETNEEDEEDVHLSNDISNDSKSYNQKKGTKQEVEYDTSPRCDKFTDEICIDDFEYPEHAILDEIYKRKDIFQLMYSEVKGDAPLVDGIPRDMDENFSSDYYYSNNDNESDDYDSYPKHNKTSEYDFESADQSRGTHDKANRSGGFVCRSEVLYAKPKLARNIKRKWRVIVNAGDFTQTVRMEKCIRPNSECRFIADNKYESRCAQISSIHRLLVFEKGKGFFIDTFRIPTACTCHVHSTKHGSDNNDSGESSISIKRNKPKSNLGETLWSLLGSDSNGPKGKHRHQMMLAKRHKNQQQQANLMKNLELLKVFPQLASVAPENVLQQLLDGYTDVNEQQYQKRPLAVDYQMEDTGDYLLPHRVQITRTSNADKMMPYPQRGMTTIVTPTSGGSGAPVVQVIHVPVSPGMLAGEERHLVSNQMRSPYYQDIGGQRNNAFSKSSSKLSKYFLSGQERYYQSPSTANSTYTTPPYRNMTKPINNKPSGLSHHSMENKSSDGPNGGERRDLKKLLDKKMNFSYHPILEYIIH